MKGERVGKEGKENVREREGTGIYRRARERMELCADKDSLQQLIL